jgi:hypothetical protein
MSPGWAGWRSASGLGVEPELAKRSSVQKAPGPMRYDDVRPGTLEHDPTVLRRIIREMGGRLAIDTYVVRGGRIALGDPMELL